VRPWLYATLCSSWGCLLRLRRSKPASSGRQQPKPIANIHRDCTARTHIDPTPSMVYQIHSAFACLPTAQAVRSHGPALAQDRQNHGTTKLELADHSIATMELSCSPAPLHREHTSACTTFKRLRTHLAQAKLAENQWISALQDLWIGYAGICHVRVYT
jgi:hypothetical protein